MNRTIDLGSVKAVLTSPWALQELMDDGGRERVRNVPEGFSRIPLIFRCVRLRCNTLARVPIHVFENGKEVEHYPFEDSTPLQSLVWLTEAALLLDGKSVSVILNTDDGYDVGIQWLNPFTVTVKERLDASGRWQRMFWQNIEGQRFPRGRDFWTQDEVYYTREFSVLSDTGSGTSAASVALMDGETTYNISRFLKQFFKGGAMPITMVTVPKETKEAERTRIEDFFKRAISGITRAFRVLAVNEQTEIKTLTPEIKSFDIKALDAHSIEAVCDAFDIPTSMIRGQAKTKAISDTERESFVNDTIAARAGYHQLKLNELLKPYGYSVDFAVEEMPEMQENEEERASAVLQYVNAGFSLAAATAILGVQVPDEFQPELELSKQRKLAKPIEIPKPTNGQVAMVKAEMERWQRKAISRLREGKPAAVEFESMLLPDAFKTHVGKLLVEARSEADIKHIFAQIVENA